MSSVQPVPATPDPNAAEVQVVPASPAQSARPASRSTASPADQALDASARVGEFHVVRLLGADEGGFTYLARDLLLQRDVVVTEHLPFALAHRNASGQVVLRAAGDANAFIALQRAFIEAAQRHARFDHPACVPLWRCWYSNGTAYAAMPYHGGTTITEARRTMTRPPEEQWLRAVAKPLLSALESVHSQPVLHLGVSPDRVAIRADGHAVLLAPGTARVLPPAHPMAAFQAPELRAPAEHLPLGAWTDLYALAATLYYAITGESPPLAQGVPASRAEPTLIGPLARAMLEMRWRWPNVTYSPGLIRTIDRALSLLPADRPQTVAQFRRGLESVDASVAPPQGVPEAVPSASGAATAPDAGDLPSGTQSSDRKPIGAMPDPKSVPVLTDTARIGADAKVTWIGPTNSEIAADLRETLGSPLPDPVPGDSDPWVANGEFETSAPAPRRRLPVFAAAAAALVGLAGLAAHIWNEQRLTEQTRSILPAAVPDRPAGATSPNRSALPASTSTSTSTSMPTPTVATDPLANKGTASLSTTGAAASQSSNPTAQVASPATPAPTSTLRPVEATVPSATAPSATAAGTTGGAPIMGAAPAVALPSTPRAACAGRSNFSLIYCMEQQCERERFRNHAQCVSLRATGEVE